MSRSAGATGSNGRCRIGVAATLLATAATACADPLEFVAHNGFEACWATSKNATTLAARILELIDGAPACIPATTGTTTPHCGSTVCSGGEPGCPTVLHAGTSQYVTGASRFDTKGGLDSFSGKITLPTVGECDFSVNTANVVLQFPLSYVALPDYGLLPDGNNGVYMTGLYVGSVSVSGLTGADISVSGNFGCVIFAVPVSVFTGMISEVEASIEAAVQPTLDDAWCPFPF